MSSLPYCGSVALTPDVEVFVNGVSINAPIQWQGMPYTATALAAAINSYSSVPNYTAAVDLLDNNQVNIYAALTGTAANGSMLSSTVNQQQDWLIRILYNMEGGVVGTSACERRMDGKTYELSNHLGNVLATVSDRKLGVDNNGDNVVDFYTADVTNATDYYPFGSQMPGRSFSSSSYRYGFQGQEKDDEIKGSGNSINYKFRMHDPRLGRFLSIDPLSASYPYNSPYAFSENSVIAFGELEGLEKYYSADGNYVGQVGDNTEIRITDNYDTENYLTSSMINQANDNGLSEEDRSTASALLMKYSYKSFSSEKEAAKAWSLKYHPRAIKERLEKGAGIYSRSIQDAEGNKEGNVFLLSRTVTGEKSSIGTKKILDQQSRIPRLGNYTYETKGILGGDDRKFTTVDYISIPMPGDFIAFIHSHNVSTGSFSGYDWNLFGGPIEDKAVSQDYKVGIYVVTALGHLNYFNHGVTKERLISDKMPFHGNYRDLRRRSNKPALDKDKNPIDYSDGSDF